MMYHDHDIETWPGSAALQASGLWALGRLAERLEAPGGGMQVRCGSVDPMWIGESMDIGCNIWNGSEWIRISDEKPQMCICMSFYRRTYRTYRSLT